MAEKRNLMKDHCLCASLREKLLSTIPFSIEISEEINIEFYSEIAMFQRHVPHNGVSIVRYWSFALIVLNIIVSSGKCEDESESEDDKTIMRNDHSAPRHNRMNVIRQIMENKMPRKALVDVNHNGRYFQDIFSEQLEPLKIQFGHVCENPNEWEQRFERRNMKNNKHQGKIRWGNKNDEYGEHYWDLNHGQ